MKKLTAIISAMIISLLTFITAYADALGPSDEAAEIFEAGLPIIIICIAAAAVIAITSAVLVRFIKKKKKGGKNPDTEEKEKK